MESMQASLFIASIVIAVLSSLVVGLRCIARALIRGFWIDDYLMIATQVLFIATCVLSATASVDGIGVRDQDPATGYAGPRDYSAARQKAWIFQITYSFTLAFVKTSIALALYRITTSKLIKAYLWFVIFISVATGFVILGVSLSLCNPLSGVWDLRISHQVCSPSIGKRVNGVFIFAAISAIITDFSCSIIPYIIIWNLQMAKKVKIQLSSVLGLSFIACAATLVRMKYISRYTPGKDYLWGLAEPYLWTLIECGVAIIVGSIPSLRPLVKRSTMISTDQKSKPVSRRATIPHETPRVPSHRSQIILHPRLRQGGSDSYELLNSEADLFKTITTTRLEMGEAPKDQWF
ncbi:hypothetical protein BDZ85DRAFT_261310 [Elsinoe ampelina]|uniref:Rhodopsin domain-containing protein n=1 Tax=Elsinoe ampelina TaxID=302913 RepID=A0A6A6GC32_9PEZI|nr:hypothetical protein BDZ85DRAFT_261310 [Elsinoe ampelina]